MEILHLAGGIMDDFLEGSALSVKALVDPENRTKCTIKAPAKCP